jgi:O-antigen ligase
MSLPDESISARIYRALTILAAVTLPVHQRINAAVLLFLLLFWIGERLVSLGRRPFTFPSIGKNKVLLFGILYVLYLIGMIYSSNPGYGWMDLETKAGILLFPVFFATAGAAITDGKSVRTLLYSFVMSVAAVSLFLLARAAILYAGVNNPSVFYYSSLSYHKHPSYFSMYLVFSISFLLYMLEKPGRILSPVGPYLHYGALLLMSVMVFLLSSKAGIFSLCLVFILYAIWQCSRGRFIRGAVFLAGISGLLVMLFTLLPGGQNRFRQAQEVVSRSEDIAASTSESTGERILIWRASLEIIREHWPAGTGTGDVKDVLTEKYKEKGIVHAFDRKLNAHNQFLQTFIALGLPGVVTLLLSFVLPGYMALKRRKFLYVAFLSVVLINLLVESMLERHDGTVFYSLFNTLLFVTCLGKGRGELFGD